MVDHIPSSAGAQTIGHLPSGTHYPPSTNTIAQLGGLSVAAKASLRAMWWARQTLDSFQAKPIDATHLYDQSGLGRNLLSSASVATETVGGQTALLLNDSVPNEFTRADALGLSADPALTIIIKMKAGAGLVLNNFPSLLIMGTDVSQQSELYLYLSEDGVGNINLSDYAGDAGAEWTSIGDATLRSVCNIVITKPAGSGYDATNWGLYLNGVSKAANLSAIGPGPLALGSGRTSIGYARDGTPSGFGGDIFGVAIFERVLSGRDLTLVQAL